MIAMIVVLIVLMVCGMPIGFSLLLGSLAYFLSADASLNIIVQKMAMTVGDSFSMMAVPFFMFAGAVMNHSGITGQIFGFADKLVGHIRGGMGHANILASVIFAGMSGSAIWNRLNVLSSFCIISFVPAPDTLPARGRRHGWRGRCPCPHTASATAQTPCRWRPDAPAASAG